MRWGVSLFFLAAGAAIAFLSLFAQPYTPEIYSHVLRPDIAQISMALAILSLLLIGIGAWLAYALPEHRSGPKAIAYMAALVPVVLFDLARLIWLVLYVPA
jgi:tryptophan-rich sensory protein